MDTDTESGAGYGGREKVPTSNPEAFRGEEIPGAKLQEGPKGMYFPRKTGHSRASSFYRLIVVQIPQVIDSPERCGAAAGCKRFRCNRRWPVWPEPGQ